MLILETQALENKGAHYYENGYRCPGSSNALYTRTDQEKQDDKEEQEAKQKAIASAGSADTSGRSSRTHSPASSRGEARRQQMDVGGRWISRRITRCLCVLTARRTRSRMTSRSYGGFAAGQQCFVILKARHSRWITGRTSLVSSWITVLRSTPFGLCKSPHPESSIPYDFVLIYSLPAVGSCTRSGGRRQRITSREWTKPCTSCYSQKE